MAVHNSSKDKLKNDFLFPLTLKYHSIFIFSCFFFPIYSISVMDFLRSNHHLSLIFIKLSPLLPIHHTLTAVTKAHHRSIATEAQHRRFIILSPPQPKLPPAPSPLKLTITDSSYFSLSFFFFLSSSTPHGPNSPAPPRRPTLTHLALAVDPSTKP